MQSEARQACDEAADWALRVLQLSGDLDRMLNARLSAAVNGSGLSPSQEAERIYRFRRMRARRLEEAGASSDDSHALLLTGSRQSFK